MIQTKRTLFSLVVLTTFIFGFNSCTEKKEKEEVPVVPAPEQIVRIAEAEDMYDNYDKRRVPLIQHYEDSINRNSHNNQIQQEKKAGKDGKMLKDGKSFDVARYVFYNYKTIKQYLAYVEQEAKKANVEITGLRFYFSNYSEDSSNVHPRQNSVMLTPTIKDDKRDRIFYIDDTDGKQQAILLTDSFGAVEVGSIDENNKSYASIIPNLSSSDSNTVPTISFFTETSLTMNRGTGAPPPYY